MAEPSEAVRLINPCLDALGAEANSPTKSQLGQS